MPGSGPPANGIPRPGRWCAKPQAGMSPAWMGIACATTAARVSSMAISSPSPIPACCRARHDLSSGAAARLTELQCRVEECLNVECHLVLVHREPGDSCRSDECGGNLILRLLLRRHPHAHAW